MIMKKTKLNIIFCMVAVSIAVLSCKSVIEIPNGLDEGVYGSMDDITAVLRNCETGMTSGESVIDLYSESYRTSFQFVLSKSAYCGVDVMLECDGQAAEAYNLAHGTAYPVYPAESVCFGNEGNVVIAPKDKESYPFNVDILYDESLEDGVTYILPLKATVCTENIRMKGDGTRVLLVRNHKNHLGTYKGRDAVKIIGTIETGDSNPLNVLEYRLEDGSYFFDYVVLFSANIQYDAEAGRIYVGQNETVKYLLSNRDKFIRPLQEKGIKVLLGILNNRDKANISCLSDLGARQFAQELKNVIEQFGLDGVSFDDEYGGAPEPNNPLFIERPSEYAANRLCYEVKKAMPDKCIAIYALPKAMGGLFYNDTSIDGMLPGGFIDIAYPDYGKYINPIGGMTYKNLGGESINVVGGGGNSGSSYMEKLMKRGYRYVHLFALNSINGTPNYRRHADICIEVAKGLYGKDMPYPEYFYPHLSTDKVPFKSVIE